MKHIGLGGSLAMLPLAYVIGISALALSPTIGVLAVVSVIGRAAEYGICNPAREVLFTAVNREDRYKAKSFIDTVVRRGGDSAVGGIYNGLRESAGFAMTTLSWIMIPFALAWTGLALFIGNENKRISQTSNDEAESQTPKAPTKT
jgi:AAA family ATP:ADP antiporter